jgi:neutral amino acid transport system permease protein
MNWGNVFENALTAAFNLEAVYFCLAAMGLNIHFGYTGLLNFGQVGFMAIAAYGLAVSVLTFNLPFVVAVLVAIGCSIVLALLLGLPTLRLRADYLAIVTIAAAEIIRLSGRSANPSWLRRATGGSSGLSGFTQSFYDASPLPSRDFGFGPINYDSRRTWALIWGWALVALGSLVIFLLMRSPWGRVLKSIREDEDAARSLGKNVTFYKMQSLILGGVFGALAGLTLSIGNQSLQPDAYSTPITIFAYTALILGGTARVFGPVFGAVIFVFLLAFSDNFLREAQAAKYISTSIMDGNQVGTVRFMLVGVGLMLLMIFRPQGIFGNRRELELDAR